MQDSAHSVAGLSVFDQDALLLAATQLRRLSRSLPSPSNCQALGDIASGLVSREASASHGPPDAAPPSHAQPANQLLPELSCTALVDASSLPSLESLQPHALAYRDSPSVSGHAVARSVSFKQRELVQDGCSHSHYTGAPAQKPASRSASLVRSVRAPAGTPPDTQTAGDAALAPPSPQRQDSAPDSASASPAGAHLTGSPHTSGAAGLSLHLHGYGTEIDAWQVQHDAVARGAYGSHNVHPDQHLQFLAPGDEFQEPSRSASPMRGCQQSAAQHTRRPASAGPRLAAAASLAQQGGCSMVAGSSAWVPPGPSRGTFNRGGAEQATAGICCKLGIMCAPLLCAVLLSCTFCCLMHLLLLLIPGARSGLRQRL